MSERKVLTKYYPPDFDPAQLTKKKGPKQVGPKVQTVRLMAPFSMKCTSCGEYIYKGRKFNARKETPESEKYLGIQIFRFYIRCTRCSSEITFKTDPKNQDYTCERGAKRNTEPWRKVENENETEEQSLDRIQQEEEEERNAMEELEAKTIDAKRDMAVADALDEIRTRNARMERANHDGMLGDANLARPDDDLRRREDEEDEEAYRKAIAAAKAQQETWEVVEEDDQASGDSPSGSNGNGNGNGVKRKAPEEKTSASFSFKRQAKKKEQVLIPGLKMGPPPVPAAKTAPAPAPAAAKAKAVLVDYGSDSD